MPVTLDDYTPGLTLYLCPLSPDGTQAWNASAFVTDSAAARNAGAVECDEVSAGNYEFDWPAGITAAGVYPYQIYNQSGGSPATATDEVVAPSSMNSWSVNADGDGAELSAREFVWSSARHRSAYDQNCTFRPGMGRVLRFSRYGGAAITSGTYALRVYKLKALGTLLLTVNAALDEVTGDIDVNMTVAQTAALDWDSVYVGQLWRTDGDDNTDDLASVILRPPSS